MIEGKCLCGKVKVELPKAPKSFGVCHCLSCQPTTSCLPTSGYEPDELPGIPSVVSTEALTLAFVTFK